MFDKIANGRVPGIGPEDGEALQESFLPFMILHNILMAKKDKVSLMVNDETVDVLENLIKTNPGGILDGMDIKPGSITKQDITIGIAVTITEIAAMMYYEAIGMISTREAAAVIGGAEPYKALKRHIAQIGRTAFEFYRDDEKMEAGRMT